jgi:hypothetical protein
MGTMVPRILARASGAMRVVLAVYSIRSKILTPPRKKC